MSDRALAPNELADLYDGLIVLIECLPEQTYPAWEFALESVLFGGDGLTEDAVSYGEQQAIRNEFKITTYREQYGDGNQVTEFPYIETKSPRPVDEELIPDNLELPVAPESNRVLPVKVDKDSFAGAIELTAEFPNEPQAQKPRNGTSHLLDPDRFPGVTQQSNTNLGKIESESQSSTPDDSSTDSVPQPNRLADLYAGFQQHLNYVPEEGHPLWRRVLESVVYGGDFLGEDAIPYGEQQSVRNDFGMPAYRTAYGNGNHVTEFPSVKTGPP
ncbi:hypothetical protein ACFQL1_16295 [Halomicroarcula sp. GCM10025709]|uniref:hypothetical protein n=1 Tax=Halomicroarcula sp. GCM10025709 TaxID=3252669 RepID=UPI00360788EE